jgi:2'-5' RNA ligase
MRLFIAFKFDEATKKRLLDIQQKLKNSTTGNFTRPENLHLTVLFLGEVTDYSPARESMARHFTSPVTLSFAKIGSFKNNIFWVGVEQNPDLEKLHQGICADLEQAGYKVNCNNRFCPHVTLGREVALSGDSLSFEAFSMKARRLSLMKSERVNGTLKYTEVFGISIA